jgi:hypothetical protein
MGDGRTSHFFLEQSAKRLGGRRIFRIYQRAACACLPDRRACPAAASAEADAVFGFNSHAFGWRRPWIGHSKTLLVST